MPALKWKTTDGVKLWIKDMTDQHIINAINHCKRYAAAAISSNLSAAYSIDSMLDSDSDGSYLLNSDINLLEETTVEDYLEDNEAYLGLVREAEKRGLLNDRRRNFTK